MAASRSRRSGRTCSVRPCACTEHSRHSMWHRVCCQQGAAPCCLAVASHPPSFPQVHAPGVAHHMPHPPSSCRSELPEGAPPIVHHHSVLRRDAQGIGGGTKGGGGGQHERQAGAGCRVGNARQVKEACTRDAPNLVGKCSEACSREGWRGPCLLQPHMLETRSFSRRVKRAQRQRPALAPTSHLARWGATLHPAT